MPRSLVAPLRGAGGFRAFFGTSFLNWITALIARRVYKAVAKTTNYRNKYSPSYPANNEISLTDAKLGTLEFRDGNWQGFWDTNIDCTIDLKEITEIEKIKTRFYQYNNSWIFFPEKIKYQTKIKKGDSITLKKYIKFLKKRENL